MPFSLPTMVWLLSLLSWRRWMHVAIRLTCSCSALRIFDPGQAARQTSRCWLQAITCAASSSRFGQHPPTRGWTCSRRCIVVSRLEIPRRPALTPGARAPPGGLGGAAVGGGRAMTRAHVARYTAVIVCVVWTAVWGGQRRRSEGGDYRAHRHRRNRFH